jgi:hypothetical protein
MNEADYNQAVAAGQVTQLDPTPQTEPQAGASLDDLSNQFQTYLPLLEKLRTGNSVCGRIHFAGTQSFGSASSGPTKILLDTIDIQNSVKVDLTNNRLIATIPGIYLLAGSVMFQYAWDGSDYSAHIYRNGSNHIVCNQTAGRSGSEITVYLMTPVYLNAGDYLELYGRYYSYTSSSVVNDGLNSTFLSITKL